MKNEITVDEESLSAGRSVARSTQVTSWIAIASVLFLGSVANRTSAEFRVSALIDLGIALLLFVGLLRATGRPVSRRWDAALGVCIAGLMAGRLYLVLRAG